MGRKSKGRRKIEMVKIEKSKNLQVSFTKCKAGILKNANEMDVICGTETDYYFLIRRQPSSVMLLGQTLTDSRANMEIFRDAVHNSNVHEIIQELEKVARSGVKLPLKGLTLSEIEKLYACLVKVKGQINQTEAMIMQNMQGKSSTFARSSSTTP